MLKLSSIIFLSFINPFTSHCYCFGCARHEILQVSNYSIEKESKVFSPLSASIKKIICMAHKLCLSVIIAFRINISDIKIEQCFDDSMSSLLSSKYMIELIVYIVVV